MIMARTGAGQHTRAAPGSMDVVVVRSLPCVVSVIKVVILSSLVSISSCLLPFASAQGASTSINHQHRQIIYQLATTTRSNPPMAWLTPSDEPSNAARPVVCSIRESHTTKCDLTLGPDRCGNLNWTSAVTFTTIGSEVVGTFVDLPDQPITNTERREASSHVAYRMPASKLTGGISVAVVRISASCCVRRLTVVGYTSAGSADHCNLNLCNHNLDTCQHGGLCTDKPGICACPSQWAGQTCSQPNLPTTTQSSNSYWNSNNNNNNNNNHNSGGYYDGSSYNSNNNYAGNEFAAINQINNDFTPGSSQNAFSELSNEVANAIAQASASASGNGQTIAPPTIIAVPVPPHPVSGSRNQRWCPDKFLCCDHGLAYYDPNHQMMCCNNRAVPVVNFTKACPELGGHFRGALLVKPAPNVTPMSSGEKPVIPPGVVLISKGASGNSTALLQRLAAAMQTGVDGVVLGGGMSSASFASDVSDLAALVSAQNDVMEMICNGITHWVARNNRARFGCCGGKIYDIVWDSCAVTSSGLGVVRRVPGTSDKNGSSKTASNSPGQANSGGPNADYATLVPPPTPMGSMLKSENEVRPNSNWLQMNVFKKQSPPPAPAVGPSVQRRRRLIASPRG